MLYMDEHYEVLIILVSRDNVIGQDMATRQRDVEALQAYGPPAFAIWPGPYIETFSVVVRNIGKLPLRNAQVVINANLLMTPVTHEGNTFSPRSSLLRLFCNHALLGTRRRALHIDLVCRSRENQPGRDVGCITRRQSRSLASCGND